MQTRREYVRRMSIRIFDICLLQFFLVENSACVLGRALIDRVSVIERRLAFLPMLAMQHIFALSTRASGLFGNR